MPFFSVIVTVYNKEKFIYETLKSICSQSFTDFELLIVNDGSTDNSLSEISKIKDARIKVFTIPNSGASNARNYGVEKSSSNYCAFIDGDDLWADFHLSETKKLIDTFPNHKIFSCASNLHKKKNTVNYNYSIENKERQTVNYFKASLKSSIINSSAFIIYKETYLETEGFKTRFSNGQEDTEYWFRLGLLYPIAFSNRVAVTIRDVENSFSKQKFDSVNRCYFQDFENIKTENKYFYKVLDNNLFSVALSCKENNYKKGFTELKARLYKRNNLSLTQKILLNSPAILIQNLRIIKLFIEDKGINFTIY